MILGRCNWLSPAFIIAVFVAIGPITSVSIVVARRIVITMSPRSVPANSRLTLIARPTATPT